MYFDRANSSLFSSDGRLLKIFSCPKNLSPNDLAPGLSHNVRRCESCRSDVTSIDGLSSSEIEQLLESEPDQCLFLTSEGLQSMQRNQWSPPPAFALNATSGVPPERAYLPFEPKARRERIDREATGKRPTIFTIRGIEAVSAASEKGLRLLILPVVLNPKIVRKAEIWRNRDSGELWVNDDYRHSGSDLGEGWERIVPWFFYRKDPPQGPIAAYVIPDDLAPGDEVLILDLIEDVATHVNEAQEDAHRLQSTVAVWDGHSFIIEPPLTFGVVG